ncbi:MAG: hypothetical protein M1587_03975, partial [Thaumarchaeota archaeon]|nr:hypothetical protein [Nitrososphaerota archaeon]
NFNISALFANSSLWVETESRESSSSRFPERRLAGVVNRLAHDVSTTPESTSLNFFATDALEAKGSYIITWFEPRPDLRGHLQSLGIGN